MPHSLSKIAKALLVDGKGKPLILELDDFELRLLSNVSMVLAEVLVKPIHDDLSGLMERPHVVACFVVLEGVDPVGYLESERHRYLLLSQHVGPGGRFLVLAQIVNALVRAEHFALLLESFHQNTRTEVVQSSFRMLWPITEQIFLG